MRMNRAVFLDRDGVINSLVYHRDKGIIDSPFTVGQFKIIPGARRAISKLKRLRLKVVVVSNQPGIAKGHFTMRTLGRMTDKMRRSLAAGGADVDGIYYCLHHPSARIRKYRSRCSCRKPRPGLLIRAAREMRLNLRNSFMIGDNISDMEAGKAAGCTTLFIGNWKCDHCRFMRAKKVTPDHIAVDVADAAAIIQKRLLEGRY